MYAASGGMYLTRQGSPPGLSSTQIVTAPAGDEVAPQRDWISQRNISTQGDLYSLSQDGQASWHSFTPTEGSYIHRTLQAGVPPVEPIPLRPLQQWLPSSDSIYPPNTVVEILGFEKASPLLIRVRTYLSNNRDPVKTTSTINNSSDVMHGGSSNILLTPAQALGTYPRRVYMSHLHSRRKYRTINLIAEPTLYSINGNNPIISWLSDDMMDKLRGLGPFVIYSDGSWSSKGDPWQHVMGNLPEHSGSIGLTFLSSSDDWRDRPVYALQIVNGEGLDAIAAFTMELFGILVSLAILSHFDTATTIYSDCEAAVKSLNNHRNSRKPIRASTRDANILSVAASHLLTQNTTVTWVKGHPERTAKDAEVWTKDMWGNHLADRTAAGEFTSPTDYQYDGLFDNLISISPFPTLDASLISSLLPLPNVWYFGSPSGQLKSKSLTEEVNGRRATRYLATRDSYRRDRDLPPKWQNYHLPLTARIWQLKGKQQISNMVNRLIFDKHWHSGNRAKASKSPLQTSQLEKCPFCPNPDSAAHWIVHCQENTRAVVIRQDLSRLIRDRSKSLIADNPDHRFSIESVTEDYLAFLSGPRTEVWVGLWTYSQLESFRSGSEDQFFPEYKRNLLKKHFLAIGKLTTETTTKIWQSRQRTEVDLADYMELHPDPSYTPPKYRFSPNTEFSTLTQTQLMVLARAATQPLPPPIQRFSLHKTSRKLTRQAPLEVPEEIQPEVIIPPLALKQAEDKVRRKRKHGAMALSHLFNHRAAQKSKIHWRRQRRAPIPLLTTPSITTFLHIKSPRKVAPEPPSPSITNITNPLPITQNLNPGSGVLSMAFQDPVRIFDPG